MHAKLGNNFLALYTKKYFHVNEQLSLKCMKIFLRKCEMIYGKKAKNLEIT